MQFQQNIQNLFKAFHWADETMLNTVPDEYLDMDIRSSFPSIRKTYNHMWDANSIWYKRLTGKDAVFSKDFSGTIAEWKKGYLQSVQQFVDMLEGKDEAYFLSDNTYTTLKGDEFTQPIFEILLHVANHGTEHRGQVITLLRNGGYTGPVDTIDFAHWYRSINKK